MTFVYSAMLWGAALAAIPVLIHLLMRSRPRVIVFPAMRFVRATHNATVARHRIKRLLLLLMRMAAIALLALALARPKLPTSARLAGGAGEPVAAMIVLDSSGSMAYRTAGESRLDLARGLAIAVVEALPPRSLVGVLWPDRGGDAVPLSADRGLAIQQIRELTYRTGQRSSMPALLERARRSLADAPLAAREIYLFNDRTRDSWAGLSPFPSPFSEKGTVPLSPSKGKGDSPLFANGAKRGQFPAVYLLDVGAKANMDLAIADARWESAPLSPRRSPVLTVTVQAGPEAPPGPRQIELEINGQVVASREILLSERSGLPGASKPEESGWRTEAGPDQPASGAGSLAVTFRLAPLPVGLHRGQVRLANPDEIAEDNVRYLSLEVGPPPRVVLIDSPSPSETGDLDEPGSGVRGRAGPSVAALVEAMLAPPPAVEGGYALVDLWRLPVADFPAEPAAGQELLDRAQAVVLADVGVLGDGPWEAFRRYVSGGGTLVILLGSDTAPAAWNVPAALACLPAAGVGRKVELPAGVASAYPNFDASPVLSSFYRYSRNNPMIDREKVFQYFALPAGPWPANTSVLLRLAGQGGPPLLLERRIGSGACLLLTSSPQPAWSEWGQMGGATWAAMLYAMTTTGVPDPGVSGSGAPYRPGMQRAWQFLMDQPAAARWPIPPKRQPIPTDRDGRHHRREAVAVIGTPDGRQVLEPIGPATGAVNLDTRLVGQYRVGTAPAGTSAASGGQSELIYSVNFDPEEYRLAKIEPEELAAAFEPDTFQIIDGADAAALGRVLPTGRDRTSREEVGALVGLALLLLLVGESFLSNRFYRRPPPPPDAPPSLTGGPSSA